MSLQEHIPGGTGHSFNLPSSRRAGALPLVQLARDSDPSDPYTLTDTARETSLALQTSGAQLYRRDTIVLYPDPTGRPYMQTMTPMIFRTWINLRLHFYVEAQDRQTGMPVRKIKTCSTSEAETILVSPYFWPTLPEIRRTHPIPMPVLRANGNLETLPEGYDLETQIYTFKS